MFGQKLSDILRAVAGSLETPVVLVLLVLIAAAVAVVISTLRKSWYRNDTSVLETATECVLEVSRCDEAQAAS